MGNMLPKKTSQADVLLLGLKGAGKTHLLMNSKLEEDWLQQYNKGPNTNDDEPQNKLRADKNNVNHQRYVSLLPTQGFNNELIDERVAYRVWDIGGSLIYGGEMGSEFFSTGTDFGLVPYLRAVEVSGIIWVVNISLDIEYLHTSKQCLHEIIFGYA